MSMLCKCFLVLVAVMCLMQFVEMARIRRDESAVGTPSANGLENIDIKNSIDGLVNKLQAFLEEEDVKKFFKGASDVVSDGAKKIKEQLIVISDNVKAAAKTD